MTTHFDATCSCGGFKFKSAGAPFFELTCHYQQCRDASKSPFTNLAFFKVTETTVTGSTNVQEFVADSGTKTLRESCTGCGEMVIDRTEAIPQIIGIVAEKLQPPYAFQPRCHVWLESKVVEPIIPVEVKAFPRGMQ